MKRTIAVIGAGAAGLTAALRAAEQGASVRLLNAHPKIGLKILMSGGTRCNVTHREVSERDFHGGSAPFVRRVLREFDADQARAWLEELGVALKLEPTGKYFPKSNDAKTVLDALLSAVQGAGVDVVRGARVIRLERPASAADRFRLGIQRIASSAAFPRPNASQYGKASLPLPDSAPDEWLDADAVILASGGLSFPRTGSDGTGLALAVALGHTLVPLIPALTPLTTDDLLTRTLQGLTLDAELSLWKAGKRVHSNRGSLLFTHFGYSGPAALDFSRHWLRAQEEGGEFRATASFLPGERTETLTEAWRAIAEPKLSMRRWLGHRLPDRLVGELGREAGIEAATYATQVDRARRSAMIERLLRRPMLITGTLGYEKAEVTAGGVRLAEINPSTLESRKAPGVYLCGEILDVEGRLGGFNFQWAWSSGTVAGKAAGRRAMIDNGDSR